MRIDAHQHFWKYNSRDYGWMSEEQAALRRDYLPPDLLPLLRESGFDGSVVVQARQLFEETEWLVDLAERHDFIKAVVGWVDLCSDEVDGQLAACARHEKVRGVRHVLQDEPDDEFMLRPDFQRGVSRLAQYGLRYDLLILPRHLANAIELVSRFPEQPFVIDHIAKPDIKGGILVPWRELMLRIGEFPNVTCKLSSLVSVADWNRWKPADFVPYLDTVVEAFGPERLMIGSDWPVCTSAGSYGEVMAALAGYVAQFDEESQRGIYGANCARFYGIADAADEVGR